MSVHLVPAGVESYSQAKLLYTSDREYSLKDQTSFAPGAYRWATRDKVFTLCSEQTAPPKNYWSVTPILGAAFYKAIGINIVLANPIHGTFTADSYKALGIERIIDSGGFQLLSGVSDYIDPDTVIENYKKSATIGMPLDLPIRASIEGYFFDSISNLIKLNDEYMLDKLGSSIDLALISHGSTVDLRKRRLDVIDRKAAVVAIAGLGTKPADGVNAAYSVVENLMYVTARYRKTARYFHALGVTTNKMFFIYSLLSSTKFVKAIGADSVTYRLSAVTGLYSTLDFRNLGLNKDFTFKVPLSCPCPVCSTVEDSRILNNAFLLESHSLWVRQKQVEYISYLADEYVAGSISLSQIEELLSVRDAEASQFRTCVNYVLECVALGKFKPMPLRGRAKASLFEKSGKFKKSSSDVQKSADYQRYLGIISSYEKFHSKKIFTKDFQR